MASLKDTTILGKLVVTDKIIKSGGTSNDILLANGDTITKSSLSGQITNNTTYSFAGGTNCFYVTPSDGSQQTVTVTPSIDLSGYVTLSTLQTISGKKVFSANHGGSSTITSDLDAIKLAAVSRDGTKGTYYPGIGWNNLEIWSSNTYVGGAQAWIGTRLVDTAGSELVDLVFATKEDNTGGPIRPIERMCITYQGRVGIGTKTPSYPLEVNGNMSAHDIICNKITFPQEAGPSMYSSSDIQGVYISHGVDTPQVRTNTILAPTTSGGTTYGVGSDGQVLKSNGTTVYWGTGGGTSFTLPTRLAATSSTSLTANNAIEQGWHYINDNATNRPPFTQVDGMTSNDYRIMTTAYNSSWIQQIATDFRSNDIFIRRNQNGTWQPWTAVVRTLPCTVSGATHSMPSITDNAIVRWATDRTATIQNSGITIDDSNNMTVPGYIKTAENVMAMKFRTHATTYETGLVYGTAGNEALTFAIQSPVTAFQIVYGTKPSSYGSGTWQNITPLFQTKDGKVIINRKIAHTSETEDLKLLDVNGDIGANDIFANHVSANTVDALVALYTPNVYCSDIIQGDSIAANTTMSMGGQTVATRNWVEEYVRKNVNNNTSPAYSALQVSLWKENLNGGEESERIDTFTSEGSHVTEFVNLTYNYMGRHNIYTFYYVSREGDVAISCSTAEVNPHSNYAEIVFNQTASHTVFISDTGSGYSLILEVTINHVTYVD